MQEEVAQVGQSCEGPSAAGWAGGGGRRLLAKSSAFLVLSQHLHACPSLVAAAEQGPTSLESSRGCFWEVRHQWGALLGVGLHCTRCPARSCVLVAEQTL